MLLKYLSKVCNDCHKKNGRTVNKHVMRPGSNVELFSVESNAYLDRLVSWYHVLKRNEALTCGFKANKTVLLLPSHV